eukprot:COSAG02_NODE_45_length_45811_cov_83.565891_13_plen_293_part_00
MPRGEGGGGGGRRSSSPSSHAERRQWRHERHEMRERIASLADLVQREAVRREADVEELEVRVAALTAENATLTRELLRSRKAEAAALQAADDAHATKRDSMRVVFEEAELEFNERWADEAEARQEAEARADLALRRQLELDQLLAEQSEEAALILDEMQRCREQAQAERQLREAQDAKHARELTELAARWERRLASERSALERERIRMDAEQQRIIAEEQVSRCLPVNYDAGAEQQVVALRDDVAIDRLDSAVTTGKAYADSILRRVERLVDERHATERAAATSPLLVDAPR